MKMIDVRVELTPADHRSAKILAATRGMPIRKLLAELIRREVESEVAKDQPEQK